MSWSITNRFCKILCLFTCTCKLSVLPCCGASPAGNDTKTWCILVQMRILSEHQSWLNPAALRDWISRNSFEFYGVMESHLKWLQGFLRGKWARAFSWDFCNEGQVTWDWPLPQRLKLITVYEVLKLSMVFLMVFQLQRSVWLTRHMDNNQHAEVHV